MYTAFATAITANPTPSLTELRTKKDLAPFVPDVPQAVRDLNANAKFLGFTNKALLKYIREAAASGVTRSARSVVYVVGMDGVGKTTMVQAMVTGDPLSEAPQWTQGVVFGTCDTLCV